MQLLAHRQSPAQRQAAGVSLSWQLATGCCVPPHLPELCSLAVPAAQGGTLVPLKAMCSKKCAAPLLSSVSYLLPASIQTPTDAVSAKGVVSEATRSPLERVVTCECRAGDCQLQAAGSHRSHKSCTHPVPEACQCLCCRSLSLPWTV